MTRDPIVEEVRAARDALARKYEYDIEAIFAGLRDSEAKEGKSIVCLPPRPVGEADESAAARPDADAKDPAGRR
jgi:hypothetical protein